MPNKKRILRNAKESLERIQNNREQERQRCRANGIEEHRIENYIEKRITFLKATIATLEK